MFTVLEAGCLNLKTPETWTWSPIELVRSFSCLCLFLFYLVLYLCKYVVGRISNNKRHVLSAQKKHKHSTWNRKEKRNGPKNKTKQCVMYIWQVRKVLEVQEETHGNEEVKSTTIF